MLFGPDWLANLFLGVFLFGVVFTIASLVLGFADIGGSDGGHVHLGGHDTTVDVGAHGHVDAGSANAGAHHGPGILNMPTIMASLTWFGGVGYLLRVTLGAGFELALVVAVLSGLAGGALMFVLLARLLWPMMSKPMLSSDYSLPGTPARVVSPIREGGVGEIVYTKNGSRFTAGARSADERPIAKGAEVVILRYERGIAYVQDVEMILREGDEELQERAQAL